MTDEELITQYEEAASQRWNDWRNAILKFKIIDGDGNIHPMPDPGLFPEMHTNPLDHEQTK